MSATRPRATHTTEARMLNRMVRWTPEGFEYEADPRQAGQLIRDLGMECSKTVGAPGVKVTAEQLAVDKKLAYGRQKPYRCVAARSNYLSAGRLGMQHAAKEVRRSMSTPMETALLALKRVVEDLGCHSWLVCRQDFQKGYSNQLLQRH